MPDIEVILQNESEVQVILVPDEDAIAVDLSDSEAIEVVIEQEGPQGAPGTGAVTDLPLTATADGQTEFNIFSLPTGVHNLIINGVTYFNIQHYTISTVGSNTVLTWLNAFAIQTTDEITFRKY